MSPEQIPARSGVDGFVDAYLRAREREQWLVADERVRSLPYPPRDDVHAAEWRRRADSARRLTHYLGAIDRPLAVWELGCGNGWLSARMAVLEHVEVVGVDVNVVELEQARRVFGGRPRLRFREGDACRGGRLVDDLADGETAVRPPDVIVLASVLQYIEDPNQLLRDLLQAVPQAEIHVLDTPIHRAADVAAARARTQRHYVSVGVEEMATHYFHHDGTVVAGLPHTVLYRPDTPWRAVERRVLRRSRSPFPWVRIRSTPGASR